MPVRCRIVLVSMEKQGGCGMIYLSVPDGAVFFYAHAAVYFVISKNFCRFKWDNYFKAPSADYANEGCRNKNTFVANRTPN